MKKFIGLALAALSFTALPLAAQTTTEAQPTTCVGKAACKVVPDRQNCLFKGIDLSDAQKEQIKALRTKKAEGAKFMRDQKMRNDSTAKAARLEARKNYLSELKTILGPEKYVQFLENSYLYGNNGGRHAKFDKMARHGKKGDAARKDNRRDKKSGDRNGKQGTRADRQMKAQAL